MTLTSDRLASALADRYRIERELGAGGMAAALAAESHGSAAVGEATLLCDAPTHTAETRGVARGNRHFSDTSRAVASETSER